jgi:queuosine precursor transporter
MVNNILSNKSSKLFVLLAGLFIASALIAEVIGVKIFSLEGSLGLPQANYSLFGEKGLSFDLTAGVLPWPIVFIFTDIINEYYGVRGVRFLSYFAAVLISLTFVIFYGVIHLTPSGWWIGSQTGNGVNNMQAAVAVVLGQGMNIIIGSIIAFIIGQLADAFVFRRIKKFTGEKQIWFRATFSTLFSQLIDSYIVILIAFYVAGDWTLGKTLAIGTNNYIYKFIVALGMTPVVYLVHNIIERYLGKDLATQMKQQALSNK